MPEDERYRREPRRGHMARMNAVEKPKNMKRAVLDLFSYGHRFYPAFIAIFFLSVAASVLAILGPNYLKELVNIILEGAFAPTGIDVPSAIKICVILTIFYASSMIFSYAQGFIMATVTQRISKGLRTDLDTKINRMPLSYFDRVSFGDTLSRATNDVDLIEITMNRSVGMMVGAVTQFFGAIIMMFYTNWILALAAIGTSLLGFFWMGVIIKHSQKFFLRQQQQLGEINGKIEEIFSAHNVVKAYGGEEKESRHFAKLNERLRDSSKKAQFMSGLMMPFMGFVGNLGFVVVVAFISYVNLFNAPLTGLANSVSSLQSAAAASERVFEFLKSEELSDESGKTEALTEVKGDVVFENVHFGYDEGKEIMHGFSAHAYPGQKIAIVGPTGAGKTTLVNLLMRFYEPSKGNIYIDGVNIRAMKRENVRDLFGMVLQDTWLFGGTIRENIAYSKNVSDETVENAAKAVGLHHFITTLPKGYDTVLDGNVNLSVGQKQLLTIARAIVEHASIRAPKF